MARKYNTESSDDDVKERRDRYQRSSNRSSDEDDKLVERERGIRDGDRKDRYIKSEAMESDRGKESYRRFDKDDKPVGRDKERSHQHVDRCRRQDTDERYGSEKSEHKSTVEGKQTDLDNRKRDRERDGGRDRVRERDRERDIDGDRERDGGRERVRERDGDRERESSHQHELGNRRPESERKDKIEKSDQESEEDDKREEKKRGRKGERTYWNENVDRHSIPDLEVADDRDGNRKSEPKKDWRDDDKQWRHGHDCNRGKKNSENRENEKSVSKKEELPAVHASKLAADPKSKSGGVYVPPFKLARMLKEVQDKSSPEYQRLTWDALRKSINGLVNKVNATNVKNIIPELFAENLIRGRGLFCRSCMKSQMASPGFTDVFAALVAVVNTKFPEAGDLLLKRTVLQLKRAYKRNDKPQLLAVVKLIAHLVNQQVAHEIIALELLTLMLEKPTDDSVEVAVGFVTECGSILHDLSPKGLHGIFERFRGILHEGEIDKRVQFLIEGLFAIRKAKFQGHPAVRPELDLVEQEDQLTLELSLSDENEIDPETSLDIFKVDHQFLENEKRYEELKKNMIGEESEDEEGADAGSDEEDDDDEDDDDNDDDEEQMQIKDETETNLVNLRRTIYLIIMSSVDFEEAGHKLLKIKLESGQEMELCIMLLECCSQERTYLRYYGILGQRFCMINKIHMENFETCFVQQYSMIHRLETNKLRNVAKFFAHLLGTDALPWHVLEYIRLTEEDTTSSCRIFIKILFQELSEQLGIRLLNERLSDPIMQSSFDSIFPKDNPKNTRFAINFFTSIGLGGITENLREYLKNMPRLIMQQQEAVSDSDGSHSSGTDQSSSDSESESSSSSSSYESDRDRRRRKRSRKN